MNRSCHRRSALAVALLVVAGCSSSSSDGKSGEETPLGTGEQDQGAAGTPGSAADGAGAASASGAGPATASGGTAAGTGNTDDAGGTGVSTSEAEGGTSATPGAAGSSASSGAGNLAAGGQGGTTDEPTSEGEAGTTAGQGGGANFGGSGGDAAGMAGAPSGVVSACVGGAWPTADPTAAGPFEVTADKNVGPLAGALPDPVYGDVQQRFNVYRPTNLADSGYCHPILVWANGHTDNPEPAPPDCLSQNYCGSYLMLMEQLASHGFVVIASLSTITSQGDPLPTIVGLDWLIEQADDPTSPYYHHLDTAHIGALGHSEGGFSTCKAASDPRISAIAAVSGSAANPEIHSPALLFCGGQEAASACDGAMTTYESIRDQPAMFVKNLAADHGGWLYQNGPEGPDIFGFTAWFRVHLMDDMGNRGMFYGDNCTLCTDDRVEVMRNDLMTQ